MTPDEMKVGPLYLVTKPSKDREFQRGDRIRLRESGSIINRRGMGWMPAEDVPEATRGMEVELAEGA